MNTEIQDRLLREIQEFSRGMSQRLMIDGEVVITAEGEFIDPIRVALNPPESPAD